MIESKIIEATELSPRVTLGNEGIIGISGKSRMEDASLFYKQIHEWVVNFISNSKTELTIKIKLDYFNSSSAKQLLKLLMTIDDASINAKVVWIYPSDNDILLERGEELAIMLDIPFEYIGYSGNYQMP